MGRNRRTPKPAEQPCDDDVLLGFRKSTQRRTGRAALQKRGIKLIVGVEESYGRVTVPEAQSVELVPGFHVRHAELEYRGRSVSESDGSHPRATDIGAVERRTDGERPSAFEVLKRIGQVVEPGRALGCVAAVGHELRRERECHSSILAVTRLGAQAGR